ncbi:GNAT family N-acetyltransferase [Umezawaea sp. Da 62-37]|uniref:GNAT family N-acetyltransferase n=1 Tax=Umezawaea sp. Da 62-37 TaxID=3075927 RepID=UPI0028F7363E|nr:GNAT family N-acetyltransferase [Umezawaea sp. Da 62-37]WNV87687.1 GNAT family N-acetyltransferase [Umezawaea sp. Da 62-37]
MTPTLRTGRLLLTPYTPADEDHFITLLADEEVCRWMGQAAETEDVLRDLFRQIFTEVYAKNLFDVWAVWSEGHYVGHSEIKRTGNVDGHEVVCALMSEFRGRGLGTELLNAVLTYGFEELNLTEVHGMVGSANNASLAMARKVGFELVREVGDGATIQKVVTLKAENLRAVQPL